jgi:hypothetical protein
MHAGGAFTQAGYDTGAAGCPAVPLSPGVPLLPIPPVCVANPVDETLAPAPAVPADPDTVIELPSPEEQLLAAAAAALALVPVGPVPPCCIVTTTSVSVSCVFAPVAKIP